VRLERLQATGERSQALSQLPGPPNTLASFTFGASAQIQLVDVDPIESATHPLHPHAPAERPQMPSQEIQFPIAAAIDIEVDAVPVAHHDPN
jgi:hypothetical protein